MYKIFQRISGIESLDRAKRYLLNAVMFCCICYIYNTLRIYKDGIVTSLSQGAEILSVLKAFCTLPAALLFFLIYDWLFKRYDQGKIFLGTLFTFVGMVTIYSFILRPNAYYLHLTKENAISLYNLFTKLDITHIGIPFTPLMLKLPFAIKIGSILGNLVVNIAQFWTGALFYVAAELWGTSILSLMFWTYVTSSTSNNDAKKIFPIYVMASSIAGMFTWPRSNLVKNLSTTTSLRIFNLEMLILCCIIGICYYRSRNLLKQDPDFDLNKQAFYRKKDKISLAGSLKLIFSDTYLFYLCAVVFLYGTTMQLAENQYKNQLMQFCNGKEGLIIRINSIVNSLQSTLVFISALFAFRSFSKTTWFRIAIATPIALVVTISTYAMIFMFSPVKRLLAAIVCNIPGLGSWILGQTNSICTTTEAIVGCFMLVLIGSLQAVIIKTLKYSYFDHAKERSFVVIDDHERRSLGKNAIDMVGSRMGKASGGLINTLILLPYLGGSIVLKSYERTNNIGYAALSIAIVSSLLMVFSVWRLWPMYEQAASASVSGANASPAKDSAVHNNSNIKVSGSAGAGASIHNLDKLVQAPEDQDDDNCADECIGNDDDVEDDEE